MVTHLEQMRSLIGVMVFLRGFPGLEFAPSQTFSPMDILHKPPGGNVCLIISLPFGYFGGMMLVEILGKGAVLEVKELEITERCFQGSTGRKRGVSGCGKALIQYTFRDKRRIMRYIQRPRHILFIAILALLLPHTYSQKKNPQFRVEVNVVSLDVEVLDPQGRAINDLHQRDFVVKENGAPVEIGNFALLSDLSLSVVVSLGTSFMPQKNLSLAKNAILQLIHLLKPEDEICFYTFDQKGAYLEQDFTRDRPKVIRALENIGVTSRSRRPGKFLGSFATPPQVGLGIDFGLAAAKKGAHGRKALLLIRDRVESLGPSSLEHVRKSGCSLIALGFSEDDQNRLTLISDQSGEKQLILGPGAGRASSENEDVAELCRTIAHLLLSRYSITYYTSLQEGKGARHIEVLVPGRDCRVLAQRSYAPAPLEP